MALFSDSPSLLDESSVVKLIEEIEKRSALYKKDLKEYLDPLVKKKLWEEVCEAVVPDWNRLSSEDKTKQAHDVQKRWGNLRTCFRRELNAQKNIKPGQAVAKRRKYLYFEELLFLLPYMENRRTEGNPEEDDFQENGEDDSKSGPSTTTPIRQRKKRTNVPNLDLDEALIKALNETNTVDEDTNFALSLVPSLQNLTAEEKLDAKIGILKIFKQIILARRVQTTFQSTSNYNVLQQPFSNYPVYQRGINILPPAPQMEPELLIKEELIDENPIQSGDNFAESVQKEKSTEVPIEFENNISEIKEELVEENSTDYRDNFSKSKKELEKKIDSPVTDPECSLKIVDVHSINKLQKIEIDQDSKEKPHKIPHKRAKLGN